MPPITIPDQCFRISWDFVLSVGGTPTEVAEFTINGRVLDAFGVEPGTPWTTAEGLALCLALAGPAYDGWAGMAHAAYYPHSLSLAGTRVAMNNTLGHTVTEARHSPAPSPAWAGTGGGSLPWQLSLCISNRHNGLGQFSANARNERGRVYLPPMNVGVLNDADDGQLSDSIVANVLGDFVTMINTTRAAPTGTVRAGFAWTPGIVSVVKHAWYDTAYWAADRVLDTQRRRRNREKGVYAAIPVYGP